MPRQRTRKEIVEDLEGSKFGKLLVLGLESDAFILKNTKWACKCECGMYCSRSYIGLVKGRDPSCGCNLKGKKNSNYTGIGEFRGGLYTRIKGEAKKRNLQCTVTPEYLWDLYKKQGGLCMLSSLPLNMCDSELDSRSGLQTASLDRIDSSEGYVEGNVQWVHKDINRMKTNFDQQYFLWLCNTIATNKCPGEKY